MSSSVASFARTYFAGIRPCRASEPLNAPFFESKESGPRTTRVRFATPLVLCPHPSQCPFVPLSQGRGSYVRVEEERLVHKSPTQHAEPHRTVPVEPSSMHVEHRGLVPQPQEDPGVQYLRPPPQSPGRSDLGRVELPHVVRSLDVSVGPVLPVTPRQSGPVRGPRHTGWKRKRWSLPYFDANSRPANQWPT